MNRVLIVEDEEHLAAGLRLNLEAEGFVVEVEENGQVALDRLTSDADGFDVVLLDVMLPGLDGFEVVRRLREAGRFVPVMLLTARSHADDVLAGFEAGADDYLPKPFDLSILLARVQGLLRRKTWLLSHAASGPEELEEFAFAGKRIDFREQMLYWDGTTQPLTLMEATLMRYFVRRAGHTVSRKALLEEVWGVREDTDTRTIDNFIARLRRYLEAEPSHPKHLQTIRGVGYRFVAEPDQVETRGSADPGS
ncbi:MAG: response regulator transcription factor [Acidobacteriota bacterium]|nr:response regulator transcription factor [Acidobacteriota bacterium]